MECSGKAICLRISHEICNERPIARNGKAYLSVFIDGGPFYRALLHGEGQISTRFVYLYSNEIVNPVKKSIESKAIHRKQFSNLCCVIEHVLFALLYCFYCFATVGAISDR